MNQLIFDFAERGYPGFDKFLGTENAELVYVLQHKHDPLSTSGAKKARAKATCCARGLPKRSTRGKKAVYIDAAATPLTEAALEADYLAIDQIEKTGQRRTSPPVCPYSTVSATAAKAFCC